ncbi:PE-PPE domain-containing protein [Gordonia sp. HY002]|uniref:PE-PPE domain-containing protein n=1 Tax=Gordonia zhenghanii TaxID=2911516 RepID=UPI001EF12E24|nr:PE-PPE domain-containing protein [Gordonia zhenghanii]MCF8569484.1 PE-PPE domain-containing protein [Gordonia zhenghanii]MCF8602345.1 PE-PPE domain-containing protein [Gordonia zhenghanii]
MKQVGAPITVLAVGGTGESHPGDDRTEVTGMLAAVTSTLDHRFTSRWVGYPAAYGPTAGREGMAYVDSVACGVAALARAVRAADGPVMVIGYSQGAAVIRTFLAHPASTTLVGRVLAVGFVADPHQPPGVVEGCTGWGVAGPGAEVPGAVPACWVGVPDDVICNASDDSLIRDVADLTDSLSVLHVRRWVADMWGAVFSRRMQNAERTSVTPRQWRRDAHRLRAAVREVRGYLPSTIAVGMWRLTNPGGGRHVSYDGEPYRRAPLTDPEITGCQVLAQWMQVEATMHRANVALVA